MNRVKKEAEKQEAADIKSSDSKKQRLLQDLTQLKTQLQNLIIEHRENEQDLRRVCLWFTAIWRCIAIVVVYFICSSHLIYNLSLKNGYIYLFSLKLNHILLLSLLFIIIISLVYLLSKFFFNYLLAFMFKSKSLMF